MVELHTIERKFSDRCLDTILGEAFRGWRASVVQNLLDRWLKVGEALARRNGERLPHSTASAMSSRIATIKTRLRLCGTTRLASYVRHETA